MIVVGLVIFLGVVYLVWPGGSESTPTANGKNPAVTTNDQAQADGADNAASADHTKQGGVSNASGRLGEADNASPATARPSSGDPTGSPDQLTLDGQDDRPAGVPRLDGSEPSKAATSQSSSTRPPTGDSSTPSSKRPSPGQSESDWTDSSSASAGGQPTQSLANVSMDELSDRAGRRAREGMQALSQGKLVRGRAMLSQLLFTKPAVLAAADAQAIRNALAKANQKLVFSSTVYGGDPLAKSYSVEPGQTLGAIGHRFHTPYQFLEQINHMQARSLRAGESIKVVKGPFDVRIDKSDFRLDLYLKGPNNQPLYIRSFPIGLGKKNSTPVGHWRIKPGSKVINPNWANPRTGEYFARDNPKNPIGEHWLALEGTEAKTKNRHGYGIHGTIAPSSIGQQSSMGCVRLHKADIKQVFNMLEAGQSRVEIQP